MFHIASPDEIKRGDTTDVYFRRTKRILDKKGIDKQVVAEVTASSLPGYDWGILAGVEELAHLFEGVDAEVYSMPEGGVFYPNEPVVRIEGKYSQFCELETPLLGFLCQASGIATKAARIKAAAGSRTVLNFGIRRMHPAISPMIDRAAYIGGMDGFSGIGAEKLIDKTASGTIPHSLIIIVGDQVKAWKYFDEVVEKEVPRIVLVDTYSDEKTEAIMAAEAIKDLFGVRLDTPGSRRGNMREIVSEVRWELDIRGFKDIKFLVSGGIDEEDIARLDNADAFGVGTSISNAPTINFAMDVVEVEGTPCAKRGKYGGKKEVLRCNNCLKDKVVYSRDSAPANCEDCGGEMKPLLLPLVIKGRLKRKLLLPEDIRGYVLEQLKKLKGKK